MAIFSFIQSMNTTFGTTIFEQVAEQIAVGHFEKVQRQREISGKMYLTAQNEVSRIMNELTAGESRSPDHVRELEEIRECTGSGSVIETGLPRADISLDKGGTMFLIDVKTVKPNSGEFKTYKRHLLEWMGSILYEDPNADIRTVIAMPYNPYHPRPYERWTMTGMLDTKNCPQFMVGEQFWNFLAGGQEVYEDLLDCFGNVGCRMRDDIEECLRRVGQ